MAGHRFRPAFWRIASAREQRQRDPCEKFGLDYQGNQALRILHVIGDLAPASGGPAKAGFEMARALARRGHDVAIYTTDFGQPAAAPRDQTRDGVRIRLFPLQAPRIWLASWPLRRALADDLPGFDLLHLHSLYLFHDWAAGSLARRIAKPYLIRPHGSLDQIGRAHV